jgi:hypothetical protein
MPSWQQVFQAVHDSLPPGGSVWIGDMIQHDDAPVQVLLLRLGFPRPRAQTR